MSMNGGVVSNNDLSLRWCQRLLQVQFTFIFEKILEVDVIQFLQWRWKELQSLAIKTSLVSSNVILMVLGCYGF